MSGNPIPTAARTVVTARDGGHCIRCGGYGNECHHRRRRGVKDTHTHAACNLVTLCNTCHGWTHANPGTAQAMGWIVSAHSDPHEQAVHTFMYGWALLNHDGTLHLVGECEQCENVTFTEGGLCMSCLRGDVCCRNPQAAAASDCGCKGWAATALSRLIERAEEREA